MAKKKHSKKYKTYKERYERGGCTIYQLYRLTQLGALRPDEFEDITGIPFDEYAATVSDDDE